MNFINVSDLNNNVNDVTDVNYIAVICLKQKNGDKYFLYPFFTEKNFVNDSKEWKELKQNDCIEQFIRCKEHENEEQYKIILEDFLKFYFQINSTFFKEREKNQEIEVSEGDSSEILEYVNKKQIYIEIIEKKIYEIDKHVINFMQYYGIDHVRGGSFIDDNINYVIEEYDFCKDCLHGKRYCECYRNYDSDSDNEPEFYCECCHKTEYFSSIEALKKHEIEIKKKERIMEKNSRCDYCGEKGHYKEHCDNVTRWPRKVSILGNSDYYSDTDSD
jgi:hypothetical protein